MKLCIITNHKNKSHINDSLIHDRLITTLGLTPKDVFNLSDVNSVYHVNNEYTHALILLDYNVTTIIPHKNYFKELNLPKIFIIDSIAEYRKEIDVYYSKEIIKSSITSSVGLSLEHQSFMYREYADAFIFYNNKDVDLFNTYYPNIGEKTLYIIPPSLGKEKDIKVNFDFFSPNKKLGFNGEPSYANGMLNISNALLTTPEYKFNIYGNHGMLPIQNQYILNNITQNNKNIRFKGRVNNNNKFHLENHLYCNTSIYSSFNFPTFTSLLNGTVPLISDLSGEVEYFNSYPFITKLDPSSIRNTLYNISNTPPEQLKDILNSAANNLIELNDNNSKEHYYKFLNSI
jgi:hypothetical protein